MIQVPGSAAADATRTLVMRCRVFMPCLSAQTLLEVFNLQLSDPISTTFALLATE